MPANPSESDEAAATARRARAEARRAEGMSVEVFERFPDDVDDSDSTIGERLTRVTRLVRAASRISGGEPASVSRSEWPGEVFVIEHRR